MNNDRKKYSADQLVRLSDVEHVRRRPGMYIGGLEEHGRLNLLLIVLDDALVQVLAGEVRNVWVDVRADGTWSFTNDGKGIPVVRNDLASREFDRDVTVLEAAVSCLRYGNFEANRYLSTSGMMGVSVAVVNFLSESFVVKVKTAEEHFQMSFQKGVCCQALTDVADDDWKLVSRTQFKFKPDPEVFGDEFLSERVLLELLPEFACLFEGVAIHFSSEITEAEHLFCFPNGLADLLAEHSDPAEQAITSVISNVVGPRFGWDKRNFFKYEKSEVVFRFHQSEKGEIRSFGNGYRTLDRGTHVEGFRQGLVNSLREIANAIGASIEEISDEQILNGVDAVVSVFQDELYYVSQRRTELGDPELVAEFAELTSVALKTQFEKHPDEIAHVVRNLIERCVK